LAYTTVNNPSTNTPATNAPPFVNTQSGNLDWSTQSTNKSKLSWSTYGHGRVLRYTAFWTALTNSDSGTNFLTTTNWHMFADCNSSIRTTSMPLVPTNTLITFVVIVPGGDHTIPVLPYLYTGYPGVTITNNINPP
jgi:hypothetical protein